MTSLTVHSGQPKGGTHLPPPHGGRPWRSRRGTEGDGASKLQASAETPEVIAEQALDWKQGQSLWQQAAATQRPGPLLAAGTVLLGQEVALAAVAALRCRAQELRSEVSGRWSTGRPEPCTEASARLTPAVRVLDRLKKGRAPAGWTDVDLRELGEAIDSIIVAETELHSGLPNDECFWQATVVEFRDLVWGTDVTPAPRGQEVDLGSLPWPTAPERS